MKGECISHVISCMDHKLTNEELAWLNTIQISLDDMAPSLPVWRSKPLLRKGDRELPLEHEAASEDFLVAELEGRCRLSPETRKREVERLARKRRKRKKYALRGRRHHRAKAATKRRAMERLWEKDPLTRLKFVFRQGVDITQEEWDRLVGGKWKYGMKVVRTGSGKLHVYNLLLLDKGKVVYDGREQYMVDVQDPALAARVVELLEIKLE
jgi:hypothetical protein